MENVFDTAVVHSVIGNPLYDFGKNFIITDEFNRAAIVEEAWREMEHAMDSEIEALNMLEHFVLSAPIGVDLSKSHYDIVGNFVPEGWKHV